MSWNTKPKKYVLGSLVEGIHDLVGAINIGCWIVVRGKPTHPAVMKNFSLATLIGLTRYKQAYVAAINPEWQKIEDQRALFASASVTNKDFSDLEEVVF